MSDTLAQSPIEPKEYRLRRKRSFQESIRDRAGKQILTEPKKTLQSISQKTLREFSAEYIEHVQKTKSKAYVRSIKLSFKILLQGLGDISLQAVTIKLLEDFCTEKNQEAKHSAAMYYQKASGDFPSSQPLL